MKKPSQFPHEYQAGGTVFRVYLAPLSKTLADGSQKEYPSFLVKYYEGVKLVSRRKPGWDEVEALIEDVVAARRAQDPERLELTGMNRRSYLAAVAALHPAGLSVDQAAMEVAAVTKMLKPYQLEIRQAAQIVVDAMKRLDDTSISTAVDFYLQHGKSLTCIKCVPEVLAELLENLTKDGVGHYHIRDLKRRLHRFATAFPGPINEIRQKEITGWLQELVKHVWQNGQQVENDKGELVSKRTRNNYRDAIFELFEFARKHGYLAKGLPTEASQTVRVKVVPDKNHIISPQEAVRVLAVLPEHLIPYTVVKLFSGLRTEEAFLLRWEDFRFNSQSVIIEAKLAKLRQRRVPPILPNLAKWLRPFQGLTGPISSHYSSPQSLQTAVTRRARKIGVVLKRNAFRNCYISYRVAQPQPAGIVAEEAGTSTRMIKTNYLELATKDEAREWFSICPTQSQISLLKAFTKQSRGE